MRLEDGCDRQSVVNDNARTCRNWLKSLALLIVLSIGTAFAQDANAKPDTHTPAEKESKITPQQADELFRSLDEILKFASDDTGMPIKHPVKHKIVSRDEVEKYLLEKMKDDPDAKRLEASEISLKKFGLVPRDFDLRTYLVALLKEQIAGFYDSKTKTMYMLDWIEPSAQKPVLAHELTHALQDQNHDIDKFGEVNDKKLEGYDAMVRDEERAARQAVLEGQATVVMIDYLLSPYKKTVVTAPEAVDMIKKQMREGGSTPLFAKAPMFLQDALMFPYDAGFDFERALLTSGGALQGYTAVYENPPTDTRQIMQPKTYLAMQHVALPKVPDIEKIVGKDLEKFDDGGFGEFDLQVLIKQWKPSDPEENQTGTISDADAPLVRSWRGGYYEAFRKKGDAKAPVQLVFLMKLANEADATQFESVYRAGLKQRYKSITMKPNGVVETEEGLVILKTDGEWFTATEGFDVSLADKLRAAMVEAARRAPEAKSAAASGSK